MTYVLFGLLLLLGLYLLTLGLIRGFAKADPKSLSRGLRWTGAVATGLMALALIFTGRGGVVVGLAAVAAPYLFARWRSGGVARDQASAGRPPPPGSSRPPPGGMSREEAYATLGLQPGADEAEIRAAHRRLMKACHPDHGGSDVLAARVNQAKDVLLG